MTLVAETTQFPGSSNLSQASFDPATGELEITFPSGVTYTYSGVGVQVYQGLQRAASAGQYFYRHIRDRYPYSQG